MARVQREALKAGDKLPSERTLAEELNVSRPSVREAMIALEVNGIVEIRPGSGVYMANTFEQHELCTDETLPGPFEILEARLHFESEAASLAAQRISVEEIEQLRAFQKAMQMLEDQDLGEMHNVDRQFHELIAKATRNASIIEIISWLWSLKSHSQMNKTFDTLIRNWGTTSVVSDHDKIIDALQQRNPERARAAMQQHIQHVIHEFSACKLDDED